MDITASPSRVSLKKGESKEVQASVSMMAEVNKADGEVVWTSSNEAAVTVVSAEGDSSKAVITGKDIGSAVVTASCTAEGRTVEARITVSVGGDFSVAVSPSVIKMGDTITFTANTNGVASASNADYAWTIDDSAVAEAVENSQNTFKAKAVGAGNASVRAVYTDVYGTESVGTAAFTVEAPKVELKVPETVELGKTFQASAAVTNLSGKAEELGISVSVSEECDALESLENDGEYMAVDVPADGDRAVISAYMEYPAGAGTDGQAYAEKNIRITVPKLSGETIYLNTADRKEKTVKAPALIKTLYAHASITEFSVRDEETAEAAYSEEDNSFTVTAGKAGNTVIDAVLPSGTILVSYPVVVTDAAENADAKDGNTDLILPDMEEIKAPQKPEDVTEEEMDAEFQEAKQSIAGLSGNTAVKENEKAIENLGAAVKANGLLEEGEKVSISLDQQLKDVTFEPVVKRNGDGAVIGLTIAPRRMVYDVTAYKTMLDEEENPIEGTRQLIDLSSDVMKKRMNFQFRFPIPSSVESLYANVEHEGDPVRQYVIENEGGNKFITVTAWHLSDFVLTFTNDRLVSPGGSNRPQSSGAGNSGGSHKDMVTGKTGEWIRDEAGWWFKYDDGTWPAGTWAELGWNNVTNWYYFNADGYMATGWKPDAGNWYYLHPDSDGTQGFMYTGWHEIGGKWYYFSTAAGGPLGAMAAGTTTPDGYKVGTDGAWIP